METETIGFIGQGWIGKHYADDFENRGYSVIRYSLEVPYRANAEAIKNCTIVFVAVPTPTTAEGFDMSAVEASLKQCSNNTIVVIKSTLLPGSTELLQQHFPDLVVLHSPEFLREVSAAADAAHPSRNLIGVPNESPLHDEAAKRVLRVLPRAPYEKIITAKAAELVKYAGNCFLYEKVLFMNMLYDLTTTLAVDFESVREAFAEDPRIGHSHSMPIHQSGRGAGGNCFIKDFEAFRQLANKVIDDKEAYEWLRASARYNVALLTRSNKDSLLVEGVYGAKREVI